MPTEVEKSIEDKIALVSANIDKVTHVNGTKIYNPIVDGKDIRYNRQPIPDEVKRIFGESDYRGFYYPIQYANIEFRTF